jgi:hypothetical protein
MSHNMTLSDEQYETLRQAAEARGQTPDSLLATLVEELRDPLKQPHYLETEEWFRHLEGEDFVEDEDEQANADAR